MRIETEVYWTGSHDQILVNRLRLKHGNTTLAQLDYALDCAKERVLIKKLETHPKHRRAGYAKRVLRHALELTPHTYKVDPMEFISTDGREFWKRARTMSSRIIPVTKVEKRNRQSGVARYVGGTPKIKA